jgi:hypothetical protein
MIAGARRRYQHRRARYQPTPARLIMDKRHSGKASGDTGRNHAEAFSIEANPSPAESVADHVRESPAPGAHDNVSAGPSPSARPPPNGDELAQAIEKQRVQLARVHAVVLANIALLQESYGLNVDGADVCYCCEVVRDLLDRVMGNLESVRNIVRTDCEPYVHLDADALGFLVGTTRHSLFRAQAVTFAIARMLSTHDKGSYGASLRLVFSSLGGMMEDSITQLDPSSLGLPTLKY